MLVDKSKSPYFDDFSEDKNFHDILFKPSTAVQVRELNQLQSMFYKQLSRFADHVFMEGSVVLPGETNYDLNFKYVSVSIPNYADVVNFLNSDAIELVGQNGITAKPKLFTPVEGSDPATFFLEYGVSSTDGTKTKFATGDQINIIYNGALLTVATVIDSGIGSKFTINNGVYYINQKFVLVREETVILDKYSNSPSKIVCIEYNESVVTANMDSSLFDNAQGTDNFTAPGADRLRVDTKLAVYPIDQIDSLPSNAVEIFRIVNGNVQLHSRGPEYNVLNDVLSQRTYEQSGDYTVKSFKIGFNEVEDVFDTADPDKFVTQLDPGIAYVRGYRVESSGRTDIISNKARSTGIINNSSISAALGYYILVEDLSTMPDISSLQRIEFHDEEALVPGDNPGGNIVGYARVRFAILDSANRYRIYLFDMQDPSGNRTSSFIGDAKSIYSSVGVTFSANLIEAELKDPSNNSLVFPLNVAYVKTLSDGVGGFDTTYDTVRQFTANLDSNGNATFTASANEVFVNQDSRYSFCFYTDTNEFETTHDKFELGGTPMGSTLTLSFGAGEAGRPISVLLQVAKEGVVQKTKTIQTHTVTGSLTNNRLYLGRADAFKLISVLDDDGNNVTSQFTLEPNKTRSYYDISYITTNSTVAEPVTATFEFLAHSAGDYFGVDSYVDFPYDEIPVEDGVRLSDVLDFRPRIANNGTSFVGTGASIGRIPIPFTTIRTDIEHYLPRRDKVYVKSDGSFGVVEGVPSLNPKLPPDPAEAMVIYTLDIPAYTFRLSDIQAKKIDNRRFTMRDIGIIEKRLSNVEYYVSLNMLELETEAKQILDPMTGANRFKNGFMADSFIDHSVGDYAWEFYRTSVASDATLRPEFSNNAIDLEFNDLESSNVVNNAGIITLPFTSVSFVRQNQRTATINVNPYAVYSWIGELKLSPEVDSWIDTHYMDPIVTYNLFNNGQLTQRWQSWELTWTGGTTSGTDLDFQQQWRANSGTSQMTLEQTTRTLTRTTTTTNIDVVDDKFIDTSVIPVMRTINIKVTGKGCRPSTRMHLFFSGKPINQFCRPNVSGAQYGDPVMTDDKGEFVCTFRVPNDEENSFRTGEHLLVATDEEENLREQATSYAEATFAASGIRNTRQRTIIATRHVEMTTETTVTWGDPIAQSFLVERKGGVFVTKIDAFFSTKSETVPISIQIREMENGFPTQKTIPGASKMLLPEEVNISEDGSIATTFEFDYPIYLPDGNEYCFVLISNSNDYNSFIATLGDSDIGTGKFVASQPYAGVMFKSQNNSTWTEDQNSDLQFEIYCAQFETGVIGTVILDNTDFEPIRLKQNPFKTTNGSDEVVIYRKHHNYTVGTIIEIEGANGGNGLVSDDLNGQHTVESVIDPNRFVIKVDNVATASGDIGDNSVIISDTIQASALSPNIPISQFSDTFVSLEARGTSGKSISGFEVPYNTFNSYIKLSNGEINELSAPWLITNANDEAINLNGEKSFKTRILIASDNPNISPVIDSVGCSIVTPFILVNMPDSYNPNGEGNWANYRTKISTLVNPADSIKVYLDVNKPQGAEVRLSARFGNTIDEVNEAAWQEVTNINGGSIYSSESFYENEFELSNINQFTSYQLMIQLSSTSATQYPKAKRLRLIALTDFSEN